jgi:hypothetical protein
MLVFYIGVPGQVFLFVLRMSERVAGRYNFILWGLVGSIERLLQAIKWLAVLYKSIRLVLCAMLVFYIGVSGQVFLFVLRMSERVAGRYNFICGV